jgi:hypothetical protein
MPVVKQCKVRGGFNFVISIPFLYQIFVIAPRSFPRDSEVLPFPNKEILVFKIFVGCDALRNWINSPCDIHVREYAFIVDPKIVFVNSHVTRPP